MDREARIAWLVDHSRRPRHRGKLADAEVQMPGGNPGCGDVVTLYLKAQEGDDRVAAVSFEGAGCTLSQAAASILAERANRLQQTFEEVLSFSYEEMLDLLGRDIAASRPACATLGLGTLKAAVKTVAMNRALRAAGHTDQEIQELRRAMTAQADPMGLVFGKRAERDAPAGAGPLPNVLVGSSAGGLGRFESP